MTTMDGLAVRTNEKLKPSQPQKPNFQKIAEPLVKLPYHFRITPVDPTSKAAVMGNWPLRPIRTVYEVQKAAEKYADHNVGVICGRGEGNLVVLDFDAAGVKERIEKETGRSLPDTYTVRSRPVTAPYKEHYYFKNTPYSFQRFGGKKSVTMNFRDMARRELSRSGILQHPTILDVKGSGGAQLVVAAGSIRADNNETYTCVNKTPPVPIPDWLADWIMMDSIFVRKTRICFCVDVLSLIQDWVKRGRS